MNLKTRSRLLRKALVQRIKSAGVKKIAVPMSAGVDSHSTLFAALEAGCKPTVYSFHLEGVNSRDFRMAKLTADHFNLKFVEVEIPNSVKQLKKDVRRMAKMGARSKTDFECFWPMMYLIPSIKEDAMFTGHGADALYCLSRKANQHFKGREDEFRNMAFANKHGFQRHLIRKLCKKHEIEYYPTFLCDPVFDIFRGSTSYEINHPIQKAPSRFAFKEYFDQIKVYTHTSFQLGDSGISEHFKELLSTGMNPGGKYRSVKGVYNEVLRELGKTMEGDDE